MAEDQSSNRAKRRLHAVCAICERAQVDWCTNQPEFIVHAGGTPGHLRSPKRRFTEKGEPGLELSTT